MRLVERVQEKTVGKDEAGLFLFHDTQVAIEMGDKAFVIRTENPFSGTIDNIYFKDREKAEKHN
jgi:hypothetical protein